MLPYLLLFYKLYISISLSLSGEKSGARIISLISEIWLSLVLVGEWFACSVGANFTPHIITVNAGEVSFNGIEVCNILVTFYPIRSYDPIEKIFRDVIHKAKHFIFSNMNESVCSFHAFIF